MILDLSIYHWNLLTKSLSVKQARILQIIVKQAKIIRHLFRPIWNDKNSTGFGTPSCCSIFSNQFLTRASKAYLTGERYWNQLIHEGMLPALAKKPPNSIAGMIITGAIDIAVSSLLNIVETRQPKDSQAYVSRASTRQNIKNQLAVIVVPIPKYNITEVIIGIKSDIGISTIILAMK